MAVLLLVFLLGLFTDLLCEPVPPPENLSVQALNTNYTLHWSWAGPDRQTATFTVHYIGKFKVRRKNPKWNTACEETSAMFCNLNPLNLHYLGIYTFRVRAAVNELHSQWRDKDFAPAKDAAVGAPTKVQVSPFGADLEVSISEPLTSNNTSMKEKILSLYYRFQYWERHTDDTSSQSPPVDSSNTVVVLEGLKSLTLYCVSVQSRTIEPNRSSVFTEPVCIKTQGGFQWGRFTWIFGTSLCLVLVIGLGILLGCSYCRKSFQKSLIQPVFINEQLWRFPGLLLTSDWQSEQCDHLTVKSSSLEHVNPRGISDWSSSSDSQDSGVYTNSSKSASQQSTQSASQQSTQSASQESTQSASQQSTQSATQSASQQSTQSASQQSTQSASQQSTQSASQQSASQQSTQSASQLSTSQQSASKSRTKNGSMSSIELHKEVQLCGQDLLNSVQMKDLVTSQQNFLDC